jgi:hypothetical protein
MVTAIPTISKTNSQLYRGVVRLVSILFSIFVVVDFNKFNLIKSFIERLPP